MRVSSVSTKLSAVAKCVLVALTAASCGGESVVDPLPTEPTLQEQLDDILSDTLQAHAGTGVSATVLMPGAQRWVGTSGVSHEAVSVTPQMLFGASSITKVYVAALTLKLVEAGLLTLEDSLHMWLDNYQHVDGNITIRQLLNHTSGVYNYVDHPDAMGTILYDPARVWTPEEILASFVAEPYCAPGAELHYSNTGYLLIGMVIEAATGTAVSGELRTRLWEPLGLNSTFFAVEETIAGTVAHPWISTSLSDTLIDFSSVARTAIYSSSWTAGAVFTTAEELAEWGQGLYGGVVLNETSRAEMLSDPGTGVGLGTDLLLGPVFASGEPVVGFIGSGVGYSGVLAYMQDSDVTVAVMMNDNNLDCLFAITSALMATVKEQLDS